MHRKKTNEERKLRKAKGKIRFSPAVPYVLPSVALSQPPLLFHADGGYSIVTRLVLSCRKCSLTRRPKPRHLRGRLLLKKNSFSAICLIPYLVFSFRCYASIVWKAKTETQHRFHGRLFLRAASRYIPALSKAGNSRCFNQQQTSGLCVGHPALSSLSAVYCLQNHLPIVVVWRAQIGKEKNRRKCSQRVFAWA